MSQKKCIQPIKNIDSKEASKNKETKENNQIINYSDLNKNLPIKKSEKNLLNSNNTKNSQLSNDFNDITFMKEYLKEYCKDFDNKFELLEQLKSGSAGSVYRGQLRNKPNSKPLAFKFLYDNNKDNRTNGNMNEKKK